MPEPAYAAFPPISSDAGQEPAEPGPGEWSVFWRDFGEGDALPERCPIPGDGQAAVDRHWRDFAAGLGRGARVLDLGCGAGIAGRTLLGIRPDLLVTGVDFAEVPAPPFPNLAILPRVRMEALPFGDASFDAAISLFGIEYAGIADTARELGRVLRPGARFGFIVHHCDSAIAIEGSTRVRGIRDTLSAPVEAAFLAGDIARIEQQRQRLREAHPGEPTVKLVSDYFWRNIRRTRTERQAIWARLVQDVAVELSLTTRMTLCAKSAAGLGAWLAPLLAIMARVEVTVLRSESLEPVGWSVGGVR